MQESIGSWKLIFKEFLLFYYDHKVEDLGYRNWGSECRVLSD